MRSTLARLLAGTLVGAAAIFATAPAAFAHGDPSSHSLEQDVLYPAVGDRPTPETELQLLGLLYAARDAGYPIKVALVANEQDLTDDLSMLSKPQAYAEFVAGEVSRGRSLRGPILVVMPMGYGLAGNLPDDETGTLHPLTRAESATLVAALGPVAGDSGEELAIGAETATRKLAALAGHPLPTVVPPAQPLRATGPPKTAHGGGPNLWLALGVFIGVFLFAALAYEAQRRFTGDQPAELNRGARLPPVRRKCPG
jgi:hypothetical protein